MPLSMMQLAELLRGMPQDASDSQVAAAAKAAEQGTPLESVWKWINRPAVGTPDALIPGTQHTHGADEGVVRRTAEDFGASLTSPLNVGLMAAGPIAGVARAKGAFGISRAARGVEAALQVPLAAEGVKQVVEGDTPGAKLGGAVEAGMAGLGIKHAATGAFEPAAVADRYMKERGLSRSTDKPPLDPKRSMRIADAYEAMPHEPNNPEVAKSYSALKKETEDQFKFLADRAGVKMEPWVGDGQPYRNSAEMTADIKKNNHLFYFPTDSGFGTGKTGDHPMLEQTESGPTNDLFRAIHDYFGHAQSGNQFGPKGEEAAWRDHLQMFSRDAQPAMTTETRGQNSWVNFGPHLRDAEGQIPAKGAPGYVAPGARPFAEQKAGLLPAEFSETAVLPQRDELARQSAVDATPRSAASGANQSPQSSAPLKLSPELLADVNQRHGLNGGSTTDLRAGRGLTPQDARYMLSPFEDRQQILDHPPTEQDLRNYVAKNEDLLTKPGHNLGTWDNEGKHYLDVSIGENDLAKAKQLGLAHKQLAIYDLVNGKDISLSAPPEAPLSDAQRAGNSMRERLVRGPVESLEQLGTPEAKAEAEKLRQANPDLFGGGSKTSTALAVAGPAASSQIDDSNPDDPNYTLKHYGKLALDLLGAAGVGAALRKGELPLQKQAASHGAALLLLGEKPKMWERRILDMGVSREELPKVRAAAQKILETQAAKSAEGLPKTRELVQAYATGKGDMDWYNTGQELKTYFGKDAPVVANLIAATSNNSTVKSNLTLALKMYAQHKANPGEPLEGIMKTLMPAINKAIAGEELQGRKVNNFAKALLGDPDAVVVDRWMMRAFGFDKDVPTPSQYDLIEHTIRELAAKQGVEPRQMQASIWFGVKKAFEEGKNRPESPAYGSLLKEKFGQAKPAQVTSALKTAATDWRARGKGNGSSGKKSFPSALQRAIQGLNEPSLPIE